MSRSYRIFSVTSLALALALVGCRERGEGSPISPVALERTETAAQPVAPAPAPAGITPLDVSDLAERVKPLVVNITTMQTAPRQAVEFFDFFGQGERQMPRRMGLGSGFIIDSAGYVITNAHVVEGASEVRVRLADEREFDAKVTGRDPKLDLALLKLENATNLPVAPLGSSESLRVGEPVLAVGNPFGLGHTVTTGIVSAKARAIGLGPYDDFIQTDASINPGNSGGPLFNTRGEVVGINTAIRAGATGIGFAIPVDALKDVLPQLREKGYVERGRLGVGFQPISKDLATALGLSDPKGALVSAVEPNGPAALAGLRDGDVIVSIENEAVEHANDLPRMVARHSPGERVKLGILRNGERTELTATLDKLDEPPVIAQREATPEPNSLPAGKLGIRVADAPGGAGAVVAGVVPEASVGELQPGDVIQQVGDIQIGGTADLRAALDRQKPGSMVLVKFRRGDLPRFTAFRMP